jgi:hypothetical protein
MMKWSTRMFLSSSGVILMVLIMLTTLFTPALLTRAAQVTAGKGPRGTQHIKKGPATLVVKNSRPLHRPVNPPRSVTFVKKSGAKQQSPAASTPKPGALRINLSSSCPTPTIDLKILVIAADGNEADLPAIEQALDYLGTPYSVYIAAQTPNGLTPDKLANGCHGYYQGIILTDGELSYYNGSSYVSALSQQEWTNLWSYQATIGVRMVSWYTYPTTDYGYQALSSVVDTSTTPLPLKLNASGQQIFSYMPGNATVTLQYAYTYLANALTDGTTTPFLTDASGHALGLIHKTSDGRETLSLTFDSNPNLLHSIVLSYGLVNWLTRGLFLGQRHIYMSPQIDDVFIDDSDWQPTTPCGTNVDNTGFTYRISGSDWQNVLAWQNGVRANAVSRNVTLTMAYNGFGTSAGAYSPDTLTPAAKSNQAPFYWVSHTYDHTNLDSVDYATAAAEITQNNQTAAAMGFTHFNKSNMVTPDISGLTNPNFLQAAFDNGIRYLVTDTSKAGYNNPSPNAGIYNSYQPQILMIPRHPNNLFYNVSTPAAWVAEYNCIYNSFWGRNLSYQEILDLESQTLLTYMLKGELDPWMFHQPNLRAYDGTHSLLGDLLSLTLQKYQQYYNLPIVSPTMDQLGMTMAQRMQYNLAGVTASLNAGGTTITITAQKAARVPVTGLVTLGASSSESYGGQTISYINLAAGQSVTLAVL